MIWSKRALQMICLQRFVLFRIYGYKKVFFAI